MMKHNIPKTATFFADVLLLWVTLSPTLVYIKSATFSSGIIASAYLVAIVYAASRLWYSPLRGVLATMYQQDKWYWLLAIFLVVVAFFSSTHSTDPLTTMRHTCLLSGTAVIGLYLGCRYTGSSLIRLLFFALAPVAVASIYLCVTDPAATIMHSPPFHPLHDGRWRGVFTHKNWLGMYMGLLSVILVGHALVHRISANSHLIILLATLMLSLLLMLKAESTTALIAMSLTVAAIIGGSISMNAHKKKMWRFSVGILAVPLLSASLLDSSLLSGSHAAIADASANQSHGFMRDGTLSGRVPHWGHVLDAIQAKPWPGYGYETFWHSADAKVIDKKNQFVASQAHSGWLDTFLDFGIAAGLLVIAWMFWTLQRSIYLASRNRAFLAPASVLLYMFIANCTESILPNHSGLLFVLMIAMAAITSRKKLSSTQQIH